MKFNRLNNNSNTARSLSFKAQSATQAMAKAKLLPNKTLAGSKGFTLIEMMIALFVLSVGMLGVVSLQTVSIRSSQEATYETSAAIMANGFIENMRATPAASWSSYTGAQGTTSDAVCNGKTYTTAQQQRDCFHKAVARNLPMGRASISGSGSSYAVQISWGDGDDAQSRTWRP